MEKLKAEPMAEREALGISAAMVSEPAAPSATEVWFKVRVTGASSSTMVIAAGDTVNSDNKLPSGSLTVTEKVSSSSAVSSTQEKNSKVRSASAETERAGMVT